MIKPILVTSLLLAALAFPVTAQMEIPGKTDALEHPTYVIKLVDGEQIVIRGGFRVDGDLTYFYLDHGGHPVFSSIQTALIDFDLTDKANDRLMKERRRRELYYQLIEERRRKILESGGSGRSLVATDTSISVTTSVQRESEEGTATVSRSFSPYTEDDVIDQPEAWWRNEATDLFTALEASNKRLAILAREHDRMVLEYNQMTVSDQSRQLHQRIMELQERIRNERDGARFLGDRLAELSNLAEELGLPLDWIIPDSSVIFNEDATQLQMELPEHFNAADRQFKADESGNYDINEVRYAPPSWWMEERLYVESEIRKSEQAIASMRNDYNRLIEERGAAATETDKAQLTNRITQVGSSIEAEQSRVDLLRNQMENLFRSARETGNEKSVGLMTGREDS